MQMCWRSSCRRTSPSSHCYHGVIPIDCCVSLSELTRNTRFRLFGWNVFLCCRQRLSLFPQITPKPGKTASILSGHGGVFLFWRRGGGKPAKQRGTEGSKWNMRLVWWLKFMEGADIWAPGGDYSSFRLFQALRAKTLNIGVRICILRVWVCVCRASLSSGNMDCVHCVLVSDGILAIFSHK